MVVNPGLPLLWRLRIKHAGPQGELLLRGARSAERSKSQIVRAERIGRAEQGGLWTWPFASGCKGSFFPSFAFGEAKKGTSLVSRSKHPITSVLAVRSSLDLSRSIAGTFQQ